MPLLADRDPDRGPDSTADCVAAADDIADPDAAADGRADTGPVLAPHIAPDVAAPHDPADRAADFSTDNLRRAVIVHTVSDRDAYVVADAVSKPDADALPHGRARWGDVR